MIVQTIIFAVLILIMWTIVILLVWHDGKRPKIVSCKNCILLKDKQTNIKEATHGEKD